MINQLILTSLESVAPRSQGQWGVSSGSCAGPSGHVQALWAAVAMGPWPWAVLSGTSVLTGLVGVLTMVLAVRLPIPGHCFSWVLKPSWLPCQLDPLFKIDSLSAKTISCLQLRTLSQFNETHFIRLKS